MTNDCWNVYTVVGNPEDIQRLYQNELMRLMTVRNPSSGNVVRIMKHTNKGLQFEYWTGNLPNKEWMVRILEEYPSLWMKNHWSEEGGYAGVIVGGTLYGTQNEIQEITWNDVVLEDEFHACRV